MESTSKQIISVIIVTCARRDYLDPCLRSLRPQQGVDLEIIVINNASDERSSREIADSFKGIALYSFRENLLYCQALNFGIAKSRGEYVLCLNDDVVLDENYISQAWKGFFKDKKVGMVSGKLMRADKKTLDSTGLFLSYWRTARERGYGKPDRGQFEKPEYVFGVNGAAAFYSRAMLESIKEGEEYFDSRFGIFYEDLDVSWRAQRKGWLGFYVPSAVAYHIRGGTVRSAEGVNRPFARRYLNEDLFRDLVKNRYLTLIKNESFLGFLLHLPGILFYECLSWAHIMFFRPGFIKKEVFRVIAAAFDRRRKR